MKYREEAIITEGRIPQSEDILRADLAFHLGDMDAYDFSALPEACAGREIPWGVFVCLHPGKRKFFSGGFFEENCEINDTGILIKSGNPWPKQVRAIETINRDFKLLDKSLYYCFDLQDARATNYADYFGTEKSIPVFQHHRRVGIPAIITTLIRYHESPSWNIPEIIDTTSFHEKIPGVIWRGDLSGQVQSPLGFGGTHNVVNNISLSDDQKITALRQSARFRLCQDHQDDDRVDVGLVIRWGSPTYPEPVSFLEPLCKPRITPQEHLSHRYLLALDGYDGPSSWYWMLNTNSLVLRQDSGWEMFGDNYFHPWVHFVPLCSDASDLNDKIAWCESHLDQCASIVANARAAWAVLFNRQFQINRQRS